MIAFAACGQHRVAARLAGVLGADTARAELSGTVKRAYEDAQADVRRALGATEFARELEGGRAMGREAAIEYALAAAGQQAEHITGARQALAGTRR
jgi:hypothetical protein